MRNLGRTAASAAEASAGARRRVAVSRMVTSVIRFLTTRLLRARSPLLAPSLRRARGLHLTLGLPLTSVLLLTASVQPARAEDLGLSVQARRVLLPLATEEALDARRLDSDAPRGVSSVLLEVTAPKDGAGWILYVRAERPTFSADGEGKSCTDLEWKLDQANAADYRPLDDHETVVLENPAGGSARIALDVRVGLDWRTDPGTYGLGLVFRVAPY